MSLTPPQFIKMLRSRDRASLVADLRSLADQWEESSRITSMQSGVQLSHAQELRQVLDLHE